MARIDTTQLIHHATNLGPRVLEVQQDPAVRKAWSVAGHDVATAAKSLTDALIETRAAWARSGEVGLRGALA